MQRPPAACGEEFARRAVRRYVAACLEVLGGFRPIGHLRSLTSEAQFDSVAAQLRPPCRSIQPGARAALAGGPPPGALTPPSGMRIRLRDLRSCSPRFGVVEAAAVLGQDERVWAMTVRLELCSGAWLCTHLQVI